MTTYNWNTTKTFASLLALLMLLIPFNSLQAFPSIPLPASGDSYYITGWKRTIDMAVPANLDGDNTLDFVAKSRADLSGTLILEARTLNSTFLWEYDTKIPSNLTQDGNGLHDPAVPWDIDQDGIDEVMTIWLDVANKIPYVIALNGRTGAEKGKIRLPAGGGNSGGGTEGQPRGIGNHYCCIGYLDGPSGKPYVCMSQGIYADGAVWAFYWDDDTNNLAHKWTYQHTSGIGTSAHELLSYDLDGDGREEILFGGTLLSPDGVKKWSLNSYSMGHVDGVTPGDLNPNVPGNEIYFNVECGQPSALMVKASDGSIIWRHDGQTDVHHGWACNVDDNHPGDECRGWDKSGTGMDALFAADGTSLNPSPLPDFHRPPEWTGDDLYDAYTGLLTWANDGFSYAADLGGGDHHGAEEIIYVDYDATSIQIKFNKSANSYPSRWQNRHYRQDVAHCGAGYGGLRSTFLVQKSGPDTTRPTLGSAAAAGATSVQVVFSESVQSASAATAGNYRLNNGVTVSQASLGNDGRTVILTTSAMTSGVQYTVTVNNIKDLAGNTIAANSTASFTYVARLVENLIVASGQNCEWFTLAVNENIYIDRTYTYSTLPPHFVGQQVLRTAMADKTSDAADVDFINFRVTNAATVYVLYTTINSTLETAWLNDANSWIKEGYTVNTTIPSEPVREVRKKIFSAGSMVNLGGQGAVSDATSMYSVVVVPASTGIPYMRKKKLNECNGIKKESWYAINGKTVKVLDQDWSSGNKMNVLHSAKSSPGIYFYPVFSVPGNKFGKILILP